MYLGCSTGALYPELATSRALEAIGQLGVTVAELMLQNDGDYSPAAFADFAAVASAGGVEIEAIHVKSQLHPVCAPDAERRAAAWSNFERTVDGAQRVGASTLVWHGPRRDEYPVDTGPEPFVEIATRLAGLCAAGRVRLAFENVAYCLLATVRDFLELGPRLPREVGFAFDPGQAADANANPMLLLRQMQGRLFDVHLRDYDPASNGRVYLLPGQGELPWPAILRAVQAAGYQGPLMLEASLGDDPAGGIAATRQFIDPIVALLGDGPLTCQSEPPPGLLEGIRLFNDGCYYECHEAIEHEWHAETGALRNLYQGILQIGVGFHHARGGNLRGAQLLLTDGLEKIGPFLPDCLGIDLGALREETLPVLAAVENAQASGAPIQMQGLPRIRIA